MSHEWVPFTYNAGYYLFVGNGPIANGSFVSITGTHDITDPQSWNKYSYTRNNPLRYTDPDCEDFWDILSGIGNATRSNAVAGLGRESGNSDFSLGQRVGDVISLVGGAIEMAGGGTIAGGGAAACGTGVLCVAGAPAAIGGAAIAVHGASEFGTAAAHLMNSTEDAPQSGGEPQRKQGGAVTEPNLPDKTIVKQDGVTVEHYTRSGDHGPPHVHVSGEGPSTRIGQAGKPLSGDPSLSSRQSQVVQENKGTIRKAVDQIGRWFRFNEQ